MRYKHDSMLPLGAFKQRGSVVGGRSMRLHGGGYEATEEDYRLMDIYYAAMDAGLSQKEAERVQMQAAMDATYGAPQVSVDTAGLTGAAPNSQGNPTIYYDAGGNVAGVLSQNGVVTPGSMNPIIPNYSSTVVGVNTPVQMVNEEGLRLYLSDPNDPYSTTTRITGIPAISGTLGESAYRPVEERGVFGTIGSDFAGMAKDPAFWKFLASAAAITGGGLAINAAIGAPGAVATAFPVAEAGLLPATELGAAGLGLTDAQAALLMEQGILPASMQTPATLAGVGLTDAQAALLMEQGILPASMQTPAGGGLGALFGGLGSSSLLQGGLALGGLAALNALAPKQGSTGGSSAPTGLSSEQLKAIVATMPSAMGNYMNMAGNPYGYGGGTIDSANVNLANLFPGFSLPTAGPYFGAGRFGDAYAPQAASTTPISPTGLV